MKLNSKCKETETKNREEKTTQTFQSKYLLTILGIPWHGKKLRKQQKQQIKKIS